MKIILLFVFYSAFLPSMAQGNSEETDKQVIRDFFNAVHTSNNKAADIVQQFMWIENKENLQKAEYFIDTHLRMADENKCPCISCQNCAIIFDSDEKFQIVSLLDWPDEDTFFQYKSTEVKKNIYLIIAGGQIYQYVLMKNGKIASVFYIKKGGLNDSAEFLLL